MPIWNKPTSKGYRQELSIIIKIYTKESKYRGNKDSFNFKLTIFYNIYRCANILYKAKVKAFLIMLKGLVLNFFYLNNTINKKKFRISTVLFKPILRAQSTKEVFQYIKILYY